jgi:hypothetical protein
MRNNCRNRRKRGQALIVTGLIVTLILMSTVYYVLETEKQTMSIQNAANSDFLATTLNAKNTVIGSLANASNGGDEESLTRNLNRLAAVLHTRSYDAEFDLSFVPLNSSPYEDGMWISWGQDGSGVSSACVSFTINVSASAANYHSDYETNITTAVQIQGVYTGGGSGKIVNVTCTVYGENGPALASRIGIFYQNQTDESWLKVDWQNDLAIVDYGNGTYAISFQAYSQEPVRVSAQINDLRDIYVMANVTCTQL